MTTSLAPERVVVRLTTFQRDAAVELIERTEISGKDAPLVTGILWALAHADENEEAD